MSRPQKDDRLGKPRAYSLHDVEQAWRASHYTIALYEHLALTAQSLFQASRSTEVLVATKTVKIQLRRVK
jgi:hypothetical protein